MRGSRVDHENGTNGKHQFDFVIFYLNGDDCDGSEEVTITIHKNANFWKKNPYYEGPLSEATDSPNAEKQRSFILRPDGEIAAFRINKKGKLFPRAPYNNAEITE